MIKVGESGSLRSVMATTTLQAADFRAILDATLHATQRMGRPYVDVSAGELHRDVGGYPGADHRMPTCCDVMRRAMKGGDEIVSAPPKGNGASLTIRYCLPR